MDHVSVKEKILKNRRILQISTFCIHSVSVVSYNYLCHIHVHRKKNRVNLSPRKIYLIIALFHCEYGTICLVHLYIANPYIRMDIQYDVNLCHFDIEFF